MSHCKKKVVCISDQLFLNKQKNKLKQKRLGNYFYAFNNFSDAFHFLKKKAENGDKFHYILIDEKNLNDRLANTFNKLTDLNGFMKKMEVIVLTGKDNDDLKNDIMQYPFVSAYLVKPVPENYVGFLIDGAN